MDFYAYSLTPNHKFRCLLNHWLYFLWKICVRNFNFHFFGWIYNKESTKNIKKGVRNFRCLWITHCISCRKLKELWIQFWNSNIQINKIIAFSKNLRINRSGFFMRGYRKFNACILLIYLFPQLLCSKKNLHISLKLEDLFTFVCFDRDPNQILKF